MDGWTSNNIGINGIMALLNTVGVALLEARINQAPCYEYGGLPGGECSGVGLIPILCINNGL
jgi:hypothetical protein